MKDSKLHEFARELRGLTDEIAVQEAATKTLKHRRDELKKHVLPEAMELAEIDSFKVEGVGTIFLKQQVFSSILKEDRPRWYDWLRANGLEDLIVEWVFPQTQKAFVKERLESGDELPDFLNATFAQEVQLRRS